MSNPIVESKIAEFKVKRQMTFPNSGLLVILDYPPYDKVLDEFEVEKFLTWALESALEEQRKEMVKKIKKEKEAKSTDPFEIGMNMGLSTAIEIINHPDINN